MAKFVLIYTGGGIPESEEEQAAELAAWGAWYADMGAAVADPGNVFAPNAMNIVPGGAVSDGAIGTQAIGYTIVTADSMKDAVALAQNCPILAGDGQVTVYETFDM